MYPKQNFINDFKLGTGNSLELILKVSERCNIACTYCYFFFGGDESYKRHPPSISLDTIQYFVEFVEDGIKNYGLDTVRIILHGGEPLLLKKERMTLLLSKLASATAEIDLELTIQTNAMLVDDDWIEIFEKFKVFVGVSLDGPPEINDLYRIDKKGRGTYQKTLSGIRQLMIASDQGRIMKPGLLCVINPDFPPKVLYDHFVNDLGFKLIDFLLPDENHDTLSHEGVVKFIPYVSTLLNLYKLETDNEVKIRLFDSIINKLATQPFFYKVLHQFYNRKALVLSISSAGGIHPDDIIRTTKPELMEVGLNVAENSLEDVVANDLLQDIWKTEETLPTKCQSCYWKNVCEGGELYHRFSKTNGFDNSSVYCEMLKVMHEQISEIFVDCNSDTEKLIQRIETKKQELI